MKPETAHHPHPHPHHPAAHLSTAAKAAASKVGTATSKSGRLTRRSTTHSGPVQSLTAFLVMGSWQLQMVLWWGVLEARGGTPCQPNCAVQPCALTMLAHSSPLVS
jgi:hypothetical protein